MTKHTPATPLPWEPSLNDGNEQDAAYLAHAANKYPTLVAALHLARATHISIGLMAAACRKDTRALSIQKEANRCADELSVVLRSLGELPA